MADARAATNSTDSPKLKRPLFLRNPRESAADVIAVRKGG
jgi:hypothetical protein